MFDSPSSQPLLNSYHENREALLRFLTQRLGGDVALAEDLTQEVWVRVAGSESAGIANPRAYLFRIAGNLALDHLRHVGYGVENQVDDETVQAVVDPSPQPDAVAEARDELAAVFAAIQTLPPRGREIFILHKFHGLEYSEIAERLGIARNTVMVHMSRSLAHLHGLLRPRSAADEANRHDE